MNTINKICLPIALLGAINYGLVGLFGLDLFSYLNGADFIRLVQIIIGAAGAYVAFGLIANK